VKGGDVLSVRFYREWRTGFVLTLAKDDQLRNIVQAGVIAWSLVQVIVDDNHGCAGQPHLLTIIPSFLDFGNEIFTR
jgi:hypothetical protein